MSYHTTETNTNENAQAFVHFLHWASQSLLGQIASFCDIGYKNPSVSPDAHTQTHRCIWTESVTFSEINHRMNVNISHQYTNVFQWKQKYSISSYVSSGAYSL